MKKSTSSVIHVKLLGHQGQDKDPSRNIHSVVKGVSTSTQNVMTPLKENVNATPTDQE